LGRDPCSQTRKRKERLGCGGKDFQKRKVISLDERVRGDGILIVITMNVNSITTA